MLHADRSLVVGLALAVGTAGAVFSLEVSRMEIQVGLANAIRGWLKRARCAQVSGSVCEVAADDQAGVGTPPLLTGGVNGATAIGLDWLRMIGPRHWQATVADKLKEHWGEPEIKDGSRYRRKCREQWPSGGSIHFDPPGSAGEHDSVIVELTGEALSGLDGDSRVDLLKDLLGLGFKCTRIDVAIDFKSESGALDLPLIVLEACERGELCRCRTVDPRFPMNVGGGLKGMTTYLGQRGDKNGSGRFVRIYDKGLQSGEYVSYGYWQRWETEFSGECAKKAACALAYASEGWVGVAKQIALGAVDFAEPNGRHCLSERPRCAWWSEFLAGVNPVCIGRSARTRSLDSWRRWQEKACVPKLRAIHDITGLGYEEILAAAEIVCEPSKSAKNDPVIRDFCVHLLEQGLAGDSFPFGWNNVDDGLSLQALPGRRIDRGRIMRALDGCAGVAEHWIQRGRVAC